MKVRHLSRTLITAAIAASAFAGAVSIVPAASAATAAHGTTALRLPVLVNCQNRATIAPRRFTITCADGNDYLTRLRWSRWAEQAAGRGTEWINNCVPNCASGKFVKFYVYVRLWRPRFRPHHRGQRYYSRMTLTYRHKVPQGFHRHRTIGLWASI